jgi:LPXTG-site transpeptidase (sortase) family protein
VVAVGLFVSGSLTMARGFADQRSIAATKNLGTIPDPSKQQLTGYYLAFSQPLAIIIPSIGVNSPLITVGKTTDGAIDTPKDPDFDKAAWYEGSPTPGQYGTAVIVGHVDSYANDNGASVFYNLAKLRPGDTMQVVRSDHTIATFKVYATRQFDRNNMPSEQVYGANSANAELRLITCAGTFDKTANEYTDNTVIFAQLI